MFGQKLKSWMETHLGRPRHKSTSHQNQKRAPKDSSCSSTFSSSALPGVAPTSTSSGGSSCSVSGTSSASNSTSSSSSTNTAVSGNSNSNSNCSTTTAIASNPASSSPCDNDNNTSVLEHLSQQHQERNSNFQARSSDFSSVTTSSSLNLNSSTAVVGADPVTALLVSTVEGQEIKNGGGDGDGDGNGSCKQKEENAIGTRLVAPGESDIHHQPTQSSSSCSSRPTVTTSVSNSTSILSGSFSNSLSSPDTGYSTDGYSPKSVYPALSFDSSSSTGVIVVPGNKSTTSTSTSKSSYAISSLVSTELLHSSSPKLATSSLSSTGSCSVQNGLDLENYAPSPSSPALTASTPFSQSCSSGISSGTGTSDSSGGGSGCFPKGQHHHSHHQENSFRLIQQKQQQQHHQHSIPEDETEKQQVIMGSTSAGDGEVREKSVQNVCHQHQASKGSDATSRCSISNTKTVIDPLGKFPSFSIDFKNQDNSISHTSGLVLSKQPCNGRTHRRAESMDARTPSQEDYKPLVVQDGEDEDVSGNGESGGNPSLVMTATAATATAAQVSKSIRTSFVINSSGQIVEFSSYKNAYSICSPRRERTRIKTNPWIRITVNNRASNNGDNGNSSSPPHANPANNNTSACISSSDEDSVSAAHGNNKAKMSMVIPHNAPLEIDISEKVETSRKYNKEGESESKQRESRAGGQKRASSIDPPSSVSVRKANLEINNRDKEEGQQHRHHVADDHDPETEMEEEDEEQFAEDETGIIDHDSSSSLLYRISTSASASDSGKGTLEPGTNRNSTESSCLLSDSTTASTRNSIISHEAEHTGSSRGGSRSGRSSSGESISSSHHHHDHHAEDDDTPGHASNTTSSNTTSAALLFTSTDHKKQQQQHIHQKSATTATVNSSTNTAIIPASAPGAAAGVGAIEERTFKNAAVSTDLAENCGGGSGSVAGGSGAIISGFPKSTSVSVGVGTTSSNKSGKFPPVMVDKETDILSDWANTDDDGDEEIETDRNDNETVTPAPSSPGTDVDRALFSQSTSSTATDIDFGDSSAATQASSTAVFPPSSLIRHHHTRYNNTNGYNNNNNKSGNGNVAAGFQNNNDESNAFGGGESVLLHQAPSSQMAPGSYDQHQQHHYQHQHNINMNLPTTVSSSAGNAPCYPSVPIIRPVLAAVSQHHGPNGMPDSYAYDITNATATNTTAGVLLSNRGDGSELQLHHHHNHHTFHPDAAMCFATGVSGGGLPNFHLDEESEYPEMRERSSSHHKGIARGALGFLRKMFKKGACSSQRHSPDSVKAGKKTRGKSDNNLQSIGLGSPLLTISEPLSNPRYSAVLTTKKQMNPALNGYFLTPTPNSFRRRSGTGTDSSDSNHKSNSKSQSSNASKQVKTDIIRLPPQQGPLSPELHQQQQSLIHHQHQQQRHSSSSHSSASSSSGLSTNGIPQQTCSTFLSPGSTNFHHLSGGLVPPGATMSASKSTNLVPAPSQSNSNTNSNSTNSSIHSLMSTGTSAASGGNGSNNNRPPSQQNQSKTPIPHQKYYANTSPTSRQSSFMSTNNGTSCNNNGNTITRGNGHSMSPPPLISENSPYLNEVKTHGFHSSNNNNAQQIHHQTPGGGRREREPHFPQSSASLKGIPGPYESPRPANSASSGNAGAGAASSTNRMNSPSFNNYSPIHRLVVTGGNHLLNRGNPNCPSGNPASLNPSMHYPSSGEPPLHQIPRYSNLHHQHHLSTENGNNNVGGGNNNPVSGFLTNSQIINRPGSHHHPTSSPSPLINHRYSSTSSPHPYPGSMSSSHTNGPQPPLPHFASPSPILRNPRYQYITSSNQNSPILNTSKRMNISTGSGIPSSHVIQPSSNNGPPSNPNGPPPPHLTTFSPLPSSSSSQSRDTSTLINNNSFNTNTITGSPNLNSSDPFNNHQRTRQVVSTSLSYNEFENLSRQQQQTFLFHNHNGNNGNAHHQQLPPQHHIISPPPPQQHPLHQTHQIRHNHHQNHYYSSPIVKQQQQLQHYPPVSLNQTLWSAGGGMREASMMMISGGGGDNEGGVREYKQRMNQNLRFNSFLVRHRQLPQFYHTQWGLQERIYETVDSEDEHTPSDEMSTGGAEFDQDGNEIDRNSELSLPVEVHRRRMRHSYSTGGGGGRDHDREDDDCGIPLFASQEEPNVMRYGGGNGDGGMMHVNDEENEHQQISRTKSKRSKPKSLSASGRPIPRPVVALPMMPGTFLSETETRLLEADKDADRKYKRLINEAEALLKEISVEKSKRSSVAAPHHESNSFRLGDCPQSDPLRRKAYDCWALRRLQQELAGCCASPPVLHRSRLNLQSPSTPTLANNPYLIHFQNMAHPPPVPQQVPYMNTSGLDGNQNNFEF